MNHESVKIVLADARPVASRDMTGKVVSRHAIARERAQHLAADVPGIGMRSRRHGAIVRVKSRKN
jgi:hypothetical protein